MNGLAPALHQASFQSCPVLPLSLQHGAGYPPSTILEEMCLQAVQRSGWNNCYISKSPINLTDAVLEQLAGPSNTSKTGRRSQQPVRRKELRRHRVTSSIHTGCPKGRHLAAMAKALRYIETDRRSEHRWAISENGTGQLPSSRTSAAKKSSSTSS